MKSKLEAVIFDGDDTLWETMSLYSRAKNEFDALLKSSAFKTDNIIEKLDDLDTEQARKFGISKDRFANSMLILYEQLSKSENIQYSQELASKIQEIGYSVFKKPILFKDSLETLHRLRDSGYKILLLTKGDQEIQRMKTDTLGITGYFDKIYIYPKKRLEEYQEVLSDSKLTPSRTWVVGNSASSDINPATKLGITGILVPKETWKFEEGNLEGKAYVVPSLKDAADIILKNSPSYR